MDVLELHGIVINSFDYSEYDRRLVVFTLERGKITIFARGVKRPGNSLMASTQGFCFGVFFVTEGKSAYNLRGIDVIEYFDGIRNDLSAYAYGSYFLEFVSYYSRENIEDKPLLSLIYVSLLTLLKDAFPNELVRSVFEIKIISLEGELPGIPKDMPLLPGTEHAYEHIVSTPPERLYTFNLREDVLKELKSLASYFMDRCIKKEFKTLKFLTSIEEKKCHQ